MKSRENFPGRKSKLESAETARYSYEFSNSNLFRVTEKAGGEIDIVISKGKEILCDLSDFLPDDWKFVGGEYVKRLSDKKGKEIRWFGWLADHDNKVIQIGRFGSPRDILTVLHEIGHAQKNGPEDLKRYNEIFEESFPGKTSAKYIRLQKEQARILSKLEREAWAYGLSLLRRLEDEYGIDIKDFFKDFDHLKSFIDENLGEYRKNFENKILGELDREFYEKLRDEEFRRLFDRS